MGKVRASGLTWAAFISKWAPVFPVRDLGGGHSAYPLTPPSQEESFGWTGISQKSPGCTLPLPPPPGAGL